MKAAPFSRTRSLPAKLERRWSDLCARLLPVPSASIWRYSRYWLPSDPDQGWKLHISATILNAGRVLSKVAPILRDHDLLYKAPISLGELAELNRGLLYGYSQVGKFITVYPRSSEEAQMLAEQLYLVTRGFAAPAIPFDERYRADGCVFYRYGAFKNFGEGNEKVIFDPHGKPHPDLRTCPSKPTWTVDLFPPKETIGKAGRPTLLKTRFRAFRAMAQRGKGGVYQAIDVSSSPPRLCVLKEGRKHGEVDWQGRDGRWRIRHEAQVLRQLRAKGVDVPEVYALFSAESHDFLALEFIDGDDLGRVLARRARRLSIEAALRLSIKVALTVSAVHFAGWVWRDCKPANLIITKRGNLRPVDFEGACPVPRPDSLPWGTKHFIAPEAFASCEASSRLPEDLFALGAAIYFIFSGRTADAAKITPPLSQVRRNIPQAVSSLVTSLLNFNPKRRPSARLVALRLTRLCQSR
jgi:hypothetical protein